MALLSKHDILSVDDLKFEIIEVPEWGGEVRIRTLSGAERDEFEASSVKRKGGKETPDFANFRARFCSQIIVDEQGALLFPTRADQRALGSKSVKGLQRVFNAGQELNAMTDEDVEELEQGFGKDADEDSTSD